MVAALRGLLALICVGVGILVILSGVVGGLWALGMVIFTNQGGSLGANILLGTIAVILSIAFIGVGSGLLWLANEKIDPGESGGPSMRRRWFD